MNTPMHERIRQTKDGIWVIGGDSHITKWCEEQGRLDTDRTVDRICELIPVGGVVIDGGASIGDHTIAYARKVGPTGQVFAFEPNPAPFCCLTMNMAPYPWVHPLRLALGCTEFSHLIIEPDNVGMSRLVRDSNCTVLSVALNHLEQWFNDLKRLDFIKLDIEGSEPMALPGMEKEINHYRPKMLVEINREILDEAGVNAISGFFAGRNYLLQNFDPTKPQDMTGTQFDLLCTPK